MKNEIDYILDDLLARWHCHTRQYGVSRGYGSKSATCADYRSATHWDWLNGSEEARAEDLMMKAFDEAVGRVPNHPQRWNTALQFEARNLHTGYSVWFSPVLPKDPEERAVLVMEARNKLLVELQRQGAITA